jgi:hypothetical protein
MMTMGTVQALEVVFGSAALVGLAFSFMNIRDARLDLRTLREAGVQNGRRWVARSMLFLESVRAAIQLIHISIALIAMSMEPGPRVELPPKIALYTGLIQWGLIVSAALVSVLSIAAWAWRKWYPLEPVATPDGAVLASIDESLSRLADRSDEAEVRRLGNPGGGQDVARDRSGG